MRVEGAGASRKGIGLLIADSYSAERIGKK